MNTSSTELTESIKHYIEMYLQGAHNVKVQEFDDGWEENAQEAYVVNIDYKDQELKLFAADHGDFVRIAMEHDKEEDHLSHADTPTAVRIGNTIISHIKMIMG